MFRASFLLVSGDIICKCLEVLSVNALFVGVHYVANKCPASWSVTLNVLSVDVYCFVMCKCVAICKCVLSVNVYSAVVCV